MHEIIYVLFKLASLNLGKHVPLDRLAANNAAAFASALAALASALAFFLNAISFARSLSLIFLISWRYRSLSAAK
jgi:hypothetical protein